MALKHAGLLKLWRCELAGPWILIADTELLAAERHGDGVLSNLGAHFAPRLHFIVSELCILSDKFAWGTHFLRDIRVEHARLVSCTRRLGHFLVLDHVLHKALKGCDGLLLALGEACQQLVEELRSAISVDQGPALHGSTHGEEDVCDVTDGLQTACGSRSTRGHPLENRVSAVLQPLEKAAKLVTMVFNKVHDVDKLQLYLLRQTLEVSLFDLQIGHVQDLVEDLVELDRVKAGG
jgi:hypothetical protein